MRLVVLLLLLMQPGQAFAHASLLAASPADGAALTAAPQAVSLRFDETVGLIALSLVGPQGAVPLTASAAGDTLSATLPPGLPRGTYLLSWRVTSADSHLVFGTVAFGVGVPPADRAAPPDAAWPVGSMALRAAFLAALLGSAGGALFRLVAEPPLPVRQGIAALAWLALGLAVLQVGVRGALLTGSSLLDPGAWRIGAGTTLATSLAVSAVGLLACALAWRRPPWLSPWLGAVGAVLAIGALPLSGHAGTADPRWLTAPALAVHGLAAAFWVGAFWPLLGLLRGGNALAAVRRFSSRAIVAVLLLAASGLGLAVVQVAHWSALTGSAYGRVLMVKLAIVAVLLALAGWNRARLTPALAAGRDAPLRRSIRAEMLLATAILAATGVLGLVPPPRAEAHHPADRAIWTQSAGTGALVEVGPGRVGDNRIALTLNGAATPREVWLDLSLPGANVAAIRRPMRLADGVWVHQGPELAVPGRWHLRFEALISDFEQTSFTTEMDIP